MDCTNCGHQLIEEPTDEAAGRAVREAAACVDDGGTKDLHHRRTLLGDEALTPHTGHSSLTA